MMMKKIKVYALLVCLLATSAVQAQKFRLRRHAQTPNGGIRDFQLLRRQSR